MPGMSMSQCQRQVLRQELRMQMVQAQQLCMRLNLNDPFCQEAYFEELIIDKFLKVLETNNYFHISQFIDYLQKEAAKPENKPKLPKDKAPGKKIQKKLCLPNLTKTLIKMCQLWHSEIFLDNGEKIMGIDFARQLLQMSKAIAQTAEKPSHAWTNFLAALENTGNTDSQKSYFISKFWLFLLAKKEAGSELSALIRIHCYLVHFFNLSDLALAYHSLQEETKDLDGLSTVEDFLSKVPPATSLINLLTYIKIICQYVRYGKGSNQEYYLNPDLLCQLLDNPELVQKINEFRNLPEIITWLILTRFNFSQSQQEAIIVKFDKILDDKDFRKSRDDKRLLWRGLNIFAIAKPAENLLHFFRLPENAKQLIKGLQAVEISYLRGYKKLADYPQEARTIDELIDFLNNESRAHFKLILNFSDEDLNLLTQNEVWRLVTRNNLLDMCLTYASLCHSHNYPRGAKIVSEVLKQAMHKSFLAWRYSDEVNHDQIKNFNCLSAWKENYQLNMILGITDGLRQRIGAINQLANLVAQRWEKVFGYSVENSQFIERSAEIEMKLRDPQTSPDDRKKLGMEMGIIKRDFAHIELIKEMQRVKPDGLGLLANAEEPLIKLGKKLNDEEAILAIEQMLELIAKTDITEVKTLCFEDSDKPYELIQVGQNPVKTCQRWNEWGSYTDCLPAYLTDSNKKVVWIKSGWQIVGRSIIRLLTVPYGKDKKLIPLLILERPYTTAWTEQMATGLIKWLVSKAEKISADNHQPVMVAVNNQNLVSVLQKALPKSKFTVRKLTFEIPKSLNEQEYADSMGGKIKAGTKIKKLAYHTFLIEASN